MLKRLEIIVVLIGLLLTIGPAYLNIQAAKQAADREFQRLAQTSVQGLDARMQTYLQSLTATAAFMRGTGEVTQRVFEHYVDDLDIARNLPGISGIGLIVPVATPDIGAFRTDARNNGYPGFDIHPETTSDEKFVIKHIFPIGPNIEASGLDITFEQGRREAAMRARKSGAAQMTPRIILVQDDMKEPGFLLLLPLFASDATLNLKNPATFRGWVYAPFVARNLMAQLTSDQGRTYQVSIFDGETTDSDLLIFKSDHPGQSSGAYTSLHTMEWFGRVWTMQVKSTPAFDITFQRSTPTIILIAGTLLSLMLATLLRNTRLRGDALREIAGLRMREITSREEENRSLINNAVTPIFLLDENDHILFANQAAEASFGYSQAAVKDRPFSDLVQEIPAAQTDGHANASGRTFAQDKLILDLQRNQWLTASGATRVTAIVRDITAETKALNEIQSTKRLYDLALQGSRIGVFDVNLQGGVSEVSDTWRQMMGYDQAKTSLNPQSTFMSRIHPDDFGLLQKADTDCIAGRAPRSVSEYRMRTPQGTWRWMRSNAVVAERSEDGRALRLIGTQTDITEERNARFERETNEKRVRQIMSAAPIGMGLVTPDGQFLEVNDAMCTLCGVSRKDLMENHRISDFLRDNGFEQITEKLTRIIKNNPNEIYKSELGLTRADGSERWGLFHVSGTYDSNTDSNLFIVQIIDITEQRRVDQLKNDFVSTVSHELRTPLTSIKGALGLIKTSQGNTKSAANARLLEIAGSNADRLTAIVNDILDVEKISAGEVQFDIKPIDLGQVIAEVVMEVSPLAQSHKNTLQFTAPTDPMMVKADPARAKQVLANLISNACKYSDNNTPITIKAERGDRMARVSVENTGPGIDKAFRPRIFTAFSQADGSDTRAKGGTGLGLNISRQIVKRLGGKIGFESVEGKQTEFWFTCPLVAPLVEQHLLKTPPKPRRETQRATILHLEDDYDFAEVVQSGLEPYVNVIHITNILQARALIGLMHLDVIIIDWGLPDGDAGVLMDEITALQPNARLLGLSADGERAPDKRLLHNMIKTRTELSSVLECVIETSAKAS